MIHLIDKIAVNALPETVFKWLAQRLKDSKSYRAWHPEHVDIRWIKGEALQEGSIMVVEEYLQGILHKFKFRVIKIIPNRMITYRPLFPLSIIATGNTFLIEKTGDTGCVFTASGKIRFPLWLFKKMHKAHEGKLQASEQHMQEEGENLKKAVELLNNG